MKAAVSVKRHKLDPEDHRRFFERTGQGMLETLAKSPNVTLSELVALAREGEDVLGYVSVSEREHPIRRVAVGSLAQGKTGFLLLSNAGTRLRLDAQRRAAAPADSARKSAAPDRNGGRDEAEPGSVRRRLHR
jgi:hypothetical protein